MNMIVAKRTRVAAPPALISSRALTVMDPLDADDPTDEAVVTTRRAICRVALVATEVAGRFQREAVDHDPMSWMLAPRRLFGGSTALDACLDRDDCLRGVLIHGLALGLDADPEFIDGLTADNDTAIGDDGAVAGPSAGDARENVIPFVPRAEGELRLFTATIVVNDGFEAVHAFHASLATEEAEVAGRLYCRLGAAAADARIVDGFDPADPLVAALVSDAICDTLALIAAEPGSPLADGLDVNIEHRFFG